MQVVGLKSVFLMLRCVSVDERRAVAVGASCPARRNPCIAILPNMLTDLFLNSDNKEI